MEKLRQILAGILAIGIISGLSVGEAFAVVPNGRVSENVPEPSGNMITISSEAAEAETPEEETNEAPETTEEITPEEEVIEPVESGENSLEEMWPVYLSLGGIAFTVLLILIINLVHRKSKK